MTATTVETCAVGFCDRPAKVKARSAGIKVCSSHYQQDWQGKPFSPLRAKKVIPTGEHGRTCTACDEYKSYSEFYLNSNGLYRSKCKDCLIRQEKKRQAAREAVGIPCSEDCTNPAYLKGMCRNHYMKEYYERNKTS
jgi:hypothetical protein